MKMKRPLVAGLNIHEFRLFVLTVAVILTIPGYIRAEELHEENRGEAGKPGVHADEEKEGAGLAVGPGKAVEGFEHGKRIKLSKRAIARLDIRTGEADRREDKAIVPAEGLVSIGGRYFIFVVKNGWYEYRQVKIGSREGRSVILADGLDGREEIVLQGAWTLRVVELDLESGEKGGEHHH